MTRLKVDFQCHEIFTCVNKLSRGSVWKVTPKRTSQTSLNFNVLCAAFHTLRKVNRVAKTRTICDLDIKN